MGDGELTHCVVCGEPLIEVGPLGYMDHHCDPKREASIESGRKKFREMGRVEGHSVATKLFCAFSLLLEEDDVV